AWQPRWLRPTSARFRRCRARCSLSGTTSPEPWWRPSAATLMAVLQMPSRPGRLNSPLYKPVRAGWCLTLQGRSIKMARMTAAMYDLMDFDEVLEKYDPVMGLEVHVELGTDTKMFSTSATNFDAPANSNV